MRTRTIFWIVAVSLALLLCPALYGQKESKGGVSEAEAKRIGAVYVQARNEANLALLDTIYAADVVVHDPAWPGGIAGLAALKAQYGGTHGAVADLRVTLDDLYIRGEKVVWIFTMAGTITGPFRTPAGEIAPSGKKIFLTGCAIDRIVGGKIVEEWVYYNPLDILVPMGFTLLPPPPPPEKGK